MKAFVAYRFTGEAQAKLEPLLVAACQALQEKGVDVYCSFFEEAEFKQKQYNSRQITEHALGIIDDTDFLFVLQTSDKKSAGMLIEVGYSLAKNIPIVLMAKRSVTATYLHRLATISVQWTTVADLVNQIKSTDFAALAS